MTPRGAVPAVGAGLAVGQGAYDVRLHFDLPRAQIVEWRVECPGAQSQGSLGEPFEAYRTRRLAQLKAERESERRTAGAMTSLLIGAVAPNVSAHSGSGPVQADAQVSGQAVGNVAGAAVANSIDPNVELAPGDVGGGPAETTVHLVTTAPGACAVTAVADDPNVGGRFELVHIRDLEAEAQSRDVAIGKADVHARAALTNQLVAFGGDPALRQKQREATARARAAAEAKAGAEARARAEAGLVVERQHEADANANKQQREAEAHARAEASLVIEREHATAIAETERRRLQYILDIRGRIRLLLISWGADVDYRGRMRARAEELEWRRWQIAMEVRGRWRSLLTSWGADVDYRAKLEARARLEHDRRIAALAAADAEAARRQALALDLAMRARVELRASLVAMGARERPPMPALRAEVAGAAPFEGATWIAGRWTWTGVEWSWSAGGWTDASVKFGAAGDSGVAEVAPLPVVVETAPAAVVEPPVITTTVSTPTIVIRGGPEHRLPRSPAPARTNENKDPKVRDHR